MSNAQDFVTSFMKNLAGEGVELTPSLQAVFAKILAAQVVVDADTNVVSFKSAFATLSEVFTFIATPAADRPNSPNYADAAVEAAKTAAATDNGLTVGEEIPTEAPTDEPTEEPVDPELPTDEPTEEPVDPDTSSLTAALGELKAANEAKANWLDDLAYEYDFGSAKAEFTADSASEVKEAGVSTYYAAAITAVEGADAALTGKITGKTAAIQDQYITTQENKLAAAVSTANIELPANMKTLLTAMEAKKEALVEKLEAVNTAKANLGIEFGAFNVANTGASAASFEVPTEATPGSVKADAVTKIQVLTKAQYEANATEVNNANQFLLIDDVIYIGQNGTSGAVSFASLAKAPRSAETVAAYKAQLAAETAAEKATSNLKDAVKAVIIAENDVYSVVDDAVLSKSAGTVGSDAVINIGTETVAVNIELTSIKTVSAYNTKAASEAAKKEVFTADFTSSGVIGDADTILFDSGTTTLAGGETPKQIATKVAATTYSTYDAKDNGNGTVTFTAKAVGDQTDAKVAGFTITDTGSTGTTAAVAVTVTTQGVADAAITLDDGAAPDSDALSEAITAQSDFAKLVEAFIESRDLNTELTNYTEAVTTAREAIENAVDAEENPGLGISLLDVEVGAVATSESDLFIFDGKTQGDITSFGDAGSDKIFVGTDYQVFTVSSGLTVKDSDVNVREAIVVENAGDTIIYFENAAFSGQTSNIASESVSITLTGVTDAEVSITDGFLTIA